MTKKLITLLLVLGLSGCAFGVGKVTPAQEATPTQEAQAAECFGFFASLGQSDACGIDGEAISVPGMNTVKALLCAAQTGVLLFLGRAEPDCAST